MSEMEFLLWVRGAGFQIAAIIFVAGILIRLFEIFSMGRKANLAEAAGSAAMGGLRTIFSRSIPDKSTFNRSSLTIVAGYLFHIGLLVIIFFLAPHIVLMSAITGFSWSAIATPVVDAFSVISMLALLVLLFHRLTNPVKRYLSTMGDYLVWLVTFLPLLTGYMAFHRLVLDPSLLLGLHILSVELLMVVFPFSKLMHSFTLFIARWYNGAISGYKGVQS